MIEKTFHIDGDLLGQKELLFVELLRHGVLQRLMEELAEDDDDGYDKEEEDDDARRSKETAFPEGPEKRWHGVTLLPKEK